MLPLPATTVAMLHPERHIQVGPNAGNKKITDNAHRVQCKYLNAASNLSTWHIVNKNYAKTEL